MDLKLRKCIRDDWDTILELRNDFYKNSFYKQTSILSKGEHYDYMEKQSKNPNFFQWMAVIDENVIGYVRILDLDVNIMVSKEFQSKGMGSMILQLLETEAKKLNMPKLIGLIRVDNLASKKIFEKNNYKLKLYWFEKQLTD